MPTRFVIGGATNKGKKIPRDEKTRNKRNSLRKILDVHYGSKEKANREAQGMIDFIRQFAKRNLYLIVAENSYRIRYRERTGKAVSFSFMPFKTKDGEYSIEAFYRENSRIEGEQ